MTNYKEILRLYYGGLCVGFNTMVYLESLFIIHYHLIVFINTEYKGV